MHMGSLATIGQAQPNNFKHIIFNNGVHDSVGGQPTAAGSEQFNFVNICIANGYIQVSFFYGNMWRQLVVY